MAILSFLFALSMLASQPSADGPRDLVVNDFYWGRVTSRTIIDDNGPFTTDPYDLPRTRRRTISPPTVLLQRETYALVKNVGTKTVKAVTWDYVFYSDANRSHELRRAEFHSKETLAPGEMKFLSQQVRDSAPTPYGAVEIQHVDFADGTSWDRGKN